MKEKNKENIIPKQRLRNDIVLVCVLLAVALLGMSIYFLTRRNGQVAEVSVDGKVIAEYPLSIDRTEEIIHGECRNVLIISDGKARITEASCPDLICAKHSPISNEGENIVCMPNRLVITVK